jgi:hypothetical protein
MAIWATLAPHEANCLVAAEAHGLARSDLPIPLGLDRALRVTRVHAPGANLIPAEMTNRPYGNHGSSPRPAQPF